MTTQSSQRKGFTLIELLVVIAIIAILAAILFPVFAKAREKARQISCVSNFKQVMLSTIMYSQDYDEYPPLYFSGCLNVYPGQTGANRGANGEYYCNVGYRSPEIYWQQELAPYVQNQTGNNMLNASRVFVCPSSPFNPSSITQDGLSNISSMGMSDNWAEWDCPGDCNVGNGATHSFVECVSPASTVFYAETVGRYYYNGAYIYNTVPGFGLMYPPIDGTNGHCGQGNQWDLGQNFEDGSWRHSEVKGTWCQEPSNAADMLTVAYSDGHVKAQTIGQLNDYSLWAIKGGQGDVGCYKNFNGQFGCWYP